jgi:sRNA-binding carbon storage regulator CsrA
MTEKLTTTLVFTVREEGSFKIGNDVKIFIHKQGSSKFRVTCIAPKEVKILRSEVEDKDERRPKVF